MNGASLSSARIASAERDPWMRAWVCGGTVSSLPVGSDDVYAFYSGDSDFVLRIRTVGRTVTTGVAVRAPARVPDAASGVAYDAALAAAGDEACPLEDRLRLPARRTDPERYDRSHLRHPRRQL